MKVVLTTLNAKYIHPNVALRWLYVARDKQHDVHIKEFVIRDNLEDVAQQLFQENADVIAFSVYIWNAKETTILIQRLHQLNPSIRLLVGGPEVTYDYDDWLNLPIEGIVLGEGERVFWQVVNGDSSNESFVNKEKPYGISAKVDIAYLETLEIPYFLEMDKESQSSKYMYIETGRGCPFQCSYCLSSLDNQVRYFSLDYIEKVLKKLDEVTCKQVKFLDRTFNADSKRSLEILQIILSLKHDKNYQFEIMIDIVDEALLQRFIDAPKGMFRFEVGVQSFNEKSLKAVRRYTNIERLKNKIKLMVDHGCILHTDLIAGLPYEDMASFKISFNTLLSLGSDEIQVGILKGLKGTRLRNEAALYDLVFDDKAPYTIQSTRWLTNQEIQDIECVYYACEKMYNNKRAKNTIDYLLQQGVNGFDLLYSLGKRCKESTEAMQVTTYFTYLFESIQENTSYDDSIIEAMCLMDYMKCFKLRPKPLFNTVISKEIRTKIYEVAMNTLGLSELDCYHYSRIEKGFIDNTMIYQCWIYQPTARCYYFTVEGELYDERMHYCHNE